MPWGYVALGAASLIGGMIQGNAAKSAASTQANASQQATNAQLQMFNQIQGNEKPFIQAGQGAQSQLNNLLGIGSQASGANNAGAYGSLNQPFNTSDWKQLSPAYQFQLQQGKQGVLNQDAAGAGAGSGAALKDLISYNQGQASTSFNNAFNMYQTQQNNVFSRLNQIATLGSNAGSNQATGASNFGQGIGQSLTNTGTALAAGQVGQANAYSGALSSASYIPWLMANQTPTATANPNANGSWVGGAANA